MELGLGGRRALVTGASRGLGRACAQALVEDGARVVVSARGETAISTAAREIGAADWSAADVSRADDVRRVVAESVATLGGLDILVTNAGGPPTGSFEQASDEDWATAHDLTLMSSV